MASSTARDVLRRMVLGTLPETALEAFPAEELLEESRRQGLVHQLAAEIDARRIRWEEPLRARLTLERRAALVRTLAQLALSRRVAAQLAEHGIRLLPLKGAAIVETVCASESERPMSDVDLLVLERWQDAAARVLEMGFVELARADHALALRDARTGAVLEIHRSLTSAPGLFPLDMQGLWSRRRTGRGQQPFVPSAEDLLLHAALHAAFQHGFSLSLVQWLDFRRLLEREAIDVDRFRALILEAKAGWCVSAALLAAETVVGARLPSELRSDLGGLPRGLARFLAPLLREPLRLVSPEQPPLGQARLALLAGRRIELVVRTLVRSRTDGGATSLRARLLDALRRAFRLARAPNRPPGARRPVR